VKHEETRQNTPRCTRLPTPSQDPRLLLELAQPLLSIGRAQAHLHARAFAEEAAAAARQEAAMEAAAAKLKEVYYGLAAQKARLEQEMVGRGPCCAGPDGRAWAGWWFRGHRAR
jgi:hypothetical protein